VGGAAARRRRSSCCACVDVCDITDHGGISNGVVGTPAQVEATTLQGTQELALTGLPPGAGRPFRRHARLAAELLQGSPYLLRAHGELQQYLHRRPC